MMTSFQKTGVLTVGRDYQSSGRCLFPSVPLSEVSSLLPGLVFVERGRRTTGSSLPRVEEVASCNLFYPGLLIWRPLSGLR
jgi:hypothetical protein